MLMPPSRCSCSCFTNEQPFVRPRAGRLEAEVALGDGQPRPRACNTQAVCWGGPRSAAKVRCWGATYAARRRDSSLTPRGERLAGGRSVQLPPSGATSFRRAARAFNPRGRLSRVKHIARKAITMAVKVSCKWGKEVFSDIEVDTAQPPLVFKSQLFTLSGVPPDRQKVMIKVRRRAPMRAYGRRRRCVCSSWCCFQSYRCARPASQLLQRSRAAAVRAREPLHLLRGARARPRRPLPARACILETHTHTRDSVTITHSCTHACTQQRQAQRTRPPPLSPPNRARCSRTTSGARRSPRRA
jgi:hypothetical protein